MVQNYDITKIESEKVTTSTACNKEKEMVTSLFCALAGLLRRKVNFFGQDLEVTVDCLNNLTRCIDASTVMKMGPDHVKQQMVVFFNDAGIGFKVF